jgi:hypothetical protein
MTKTEREALKLARDLIVNKRERFVCLALKEISATHPELDSACTGMKRYVNRLLMPYDNLQDWQRANGFDGVQSRDADQRQADRVAWIDWILGQ